VDQNSARQNDALKEPYSLSSKKEGMIVSEVGNTYQIDNKRSEVENIGRGYGANRILYRKHL
jgi:hypothetical protein